MAWKPSKTKCGVAICNCPAHGQNGLGLSIGETIHILEDFHAADNSITWYRGKSLRSKGKMGVFPATCVTAKPFKVENEGQYETVTPSQDSTVKEVGYILNEWCPLWKKLYLTRNKELFHNVGKVMHELVRLRRKLLSDTVTNDQVREVKQRIISRIDWGNRNLGLEFVPRMNDEQVEPEGTSAVQLYRIHAESTQAQDTLPTDETDSRLTVLKPAHTYHILFHLKGFVCNIGDDAEIYISLYDANLNCHISERFLAVYTKNGIPVDIEKIHDYRALFTSLGYSDLQKDLYIVAHVYRRGKMKLSESSKKAPSKVQYIYKRPYGCAAHSLREFLQSVERNQETEFYMKVQSCNENESQFPLILENIIKKQTQGGRYITSGSPTQTLVGSLLCLDGDLQEVRLQNPLLFTRPVAIANKLGFPDVIKPADVRNNLYVTLVGGEFEKGEKVAQKKKVAQKNVEATISVFDSDGNLIKESIIGGSGEQPTSEYHSAVFYHNDKPEWNETVDISLNIDQFSGSHIRIDLKHCSTRDRAERKLFGFAFVKITSPEGVTLADGVHNLCVYKCEDLKKLQSPSAYLPLISFLEDQGNPEMMAKLPSKPPFELSRDRFYLASKLCSTKFTQKADLLAVLQWKKNPGRLSVVLEKLQKLDGEEVVQFLQDILDAVFDMFGSPAQMSQNSGPLFNAFVYILNLLKQPKFENFIPVLDTYISTTFSASSMYKDLVVCMKDVINQAIETSNGTSLVQTFEVLDYLFKVLVRSRQLARTMSLGGDQEFSKDIQSLVHIMGSLLSLNVQSLQQAQESLLQHMFGCCEVLEQVLSQRVVCILLCDLLKSCREARGTFLIAKTGLLRDCVNSQLFRMHECRKVLLPLCKAQIKKCLIQKGGVVPCTNLLADILHCLSTLKQEKMDVYEDVKTLVLALFDVVMQTAQHYEAQYDEPEQHKVAPLVACIIEMLQLMEDSHYSEVLQSYPKGKPMKQFLIRVLTTFQELIKANIFPQDWFVMKMVTNNVILTAVQYFAQALTDHFHEDLDFDYQIWSSYFHLAVAFITQPSLQLETFSEGKRQKIIDKYGDMRVLLGFQIQTLWQSLENQKHWFIPHLIGPFLQITMVPEAELRKATIPIFYDMMECEHQRKGHFKEVENEVILQLDHLVTSNKGDVEYKQLFKKILEEKLRGNMGLKESGTAFIRAITNLLEQLLDYRQVLDGEENRDKRMHCTFNILNFYKADGNRTEMYMRYIDKLHCLHVDAQNFVEAGFTLLLYADLLPAAWEDDPLPAELSYPPQRVWERKEALYKDIIEHFDKGKAWEYSIPLCKQLAHLYENKCYDYKKLSDILQKQARFFTNILEGPALRQSPAYYRIAYYGQSFPPFVRNKEFVYRGEECQRLGVLIHQLQTEFPSATIMSTNTPPEDSIKQGQAQFIQICIVKPVPKSRPDFVENSVPTEIQQFYKANEVDTFQLDIPCHRGEKDKNNEFKTLCIERTILQTAFTLPGILRSFEVVSTRKVSLTPIEVAIERMNEVNMELRSLIDKCRMKPTDHFNQLEMRLNGVISAKVNGGIPVFQEAFFTAEFPQQHPEEAKHLGTLKATLVEQIQLLETGLKLHGMIAPPSLQPLHKSLEDNFRGLKRTVRESGSPAFSHSLHSSPASSGGRPHTGSMQSLTSTPPSSNRSSTTSGDIGVDINLMRFEDDDIYTEAEDYETVPSLPKKRQSLSSSQSSLSTTSLSSTASSRPQSVLMEGESPKAKEMSRSSINASDSNLLASRVPPASAQTDKAVLTNSRSTESIRPRPTVPSSSLRRQASDPDTSIGADGEKAPPLPVRRPTTGSPRAMTLASPVNGKASPPPAAPRLARKPSGGQLGVLAEDRLSSVQENSTPNGTSRAPGAAPPIPPKAQAKVPPQVPPPIPCARPTISSRRPPPPPRKNSQNESSVEDNTKL